MGKWVKNNYSECPLSLMFFQDKAAKNNHWFSCEKGFQLGDRSQGRTQCLPVTALLLLGKVYAEEERTFKYSPLESNNPFTRRSKWPEVGRGHRLEMQMISCWGENKNMLFKKQKKEFWFPATRQSGCRSLWDNPWPVLCHLDGHGSTPPQHLSLVPNTTIS